jgi:hypothetical protein
MKGRDRAEFSDMNNRRHSNEREISTGPMGANVTALGLDSID